MCLVMQSDLAINLFVVLEGKYFKSAWPGQKEECFWILFRSQFLFLDMPGRKKKKSKTQKENKTQRKKNGRIYF